MVGADITPVDEDEDAETYYLGLLAKQQEQHKLIVGELEKQVSMYEQQFLKMLPFCVEAFSLLSAADEYMGDLTLKGPTPAFITQTNIRLWLQRFHSHVSEHASGPDDSDGTDLET